MTLANPARDALAIAKMFMDAGFLSVETKIDLGIDAFNKALAGFEIISRGADLVVVYYSGQGIEFDGQNYLIPVDADRARLGREVSGRPARPLAGYGRGRVEAETNHPRRLSYRSVQGDVAHEIRRSRCAWTSWRRMNLSAYSARAGTVAADGEAGGDSPYTKALLKRLMTPGLDVELALRRARDDVISETHREQEPFYYGSMGGDPLPLMTKPPTAVAARQPTASPRAAATPEERVARLEEQDPVVSECDRLAASPLDPLRPPGILGVEVDKMDASRAVTACRAAASARPSDARITFQLARALGKNNETQAEAMYIYCQAAEAGEPAAMNNFGSSYDNGKGVALDHTEAALWLRKAPAAGLPIGMSYTGEMYEAGKGIPRDIGQAVSWYRKAAEAGLPQGMVNLGFMYQNGQGVERDPAQAVSWIRKAAELGDARGATNLGYMLENGLGAPRDLTQAAANYRIGAEGGLPRGMANLGAMYRDGLGVEKDPAQAVSWFRKATGAIRSASPT